VWWLLAGCAPGPFGQDEAEAAWVALDGVGGDVWAAIWAATAPDAAEGGATYAPGVTWEEGAFAGALEGPGSWTGAVELDGTHGPLGEDEGSGHAWDVAVGYRDVGFGASRLEGDLTWAVEVRADGGNASQASTLVGALVGAGAAAGAGDVELTSTAALAGGRTTVTVTGFIGEWRMDRTYDATAYAR
jgi:hypothetical protein